MSSAITRVLYKNLIRTAREYDSRPWNRAWLIASPSLRPIIGSTEFYLSSQQSCVNIVRQQFRHPSNTSQQQQHALALSALRQMTLNSYDAAMRIQDRPLPYEIPNDQKNVFHRFSSAVDEDENEEEEEDNDEDNDEESSVFEDAEDTDEFAADELVQNPSTDVDVTADSTSVTDAEPLKPDHAIAIPSVKQLQRELDQWSAEEIEDAIVAGLQNEHQSSSASTSSSSQSNNPHMLLDFHSVVQQVKAYRSKRLAEGVSATAKQDTAERDDSDLDSMDHLVKAEDLAFENTLEYQREVDHVKLVISSREQRLSFDQVYAFSKPELLQLSRHIKNLEAASNELLRPDTDKHTESEAEEILPVEEALNFFLPGFASRTDQYHVLSSKLSRSHYSHCLNNLHFHVLIDHCIRSQSDRGCIRLFIAMKERGFKLTRTMVTRLLLRCRDARRPFEAMAVLRDSQFGNIMKLATAVVTPPAEQDLTESHTSEPLPTHTHTLESLFPTAHNLPPVKQPHQPFVDKARAASMVQAERDRLKRDGPLVEILIQACLHSDYTDDLRDRVEEAMYDNEQLEHEFPLHGPHWQSIKNGIPHIAVDHFDLMQQYQIPFTRLSTVRTLIDIGDSIHDTRFSMLVVQKAVNDGLVLDLACLNDLIDHAIYHQHTQLLLDTLNLADRLKIKVTNDFYAKCILYIMNVSDPFKYELIRSWALNAGIEVEVSVNGDSTKLPEKLASSIITMLMVHAEDRGFDGSAVRRRVVHLVVSDFVEDLKQNLRDMSGDDWLANEEDDDDDLGPDSDRGDDPDDE